MGLWEQFPYTNFHELNLQWVLQLLKDLNERVKTLENVDIRQLIINELNIMVDDGTFERLFSSMLDEIRRAIAELESLVQSNTDDIASLNASQDVQDGLISGLRTDMTQAQQDIEALRNAIQILDPTGEIGDIAETIAEMQAIITTIQNTIVSIQNTINNHETRITNLENGGVIPFVDRYRGNDLTGTMPLSEFVTHAQAQDGRVLLGDYVTVQYTDPETLETASAQCVLADNDCIVIRGTKHYAFGRPLPNNSGYYHSTIKTYADMLVQAVCDANNVTPKMLTVWLAAKGWFETSGNVTYLAPTVNGESHYGLLLSSCAVFGYPMFGALDNNGFYKQLPLFKYERPYHDTLLSDVVCDNTFEISGDDVNIGYGKNCRIQNQRHSDMLAFSQGNTYNSQYPCLFAFYF